MRSVAITGVSGYLGVQMLKKLDEEKEVETVVGIDIRPPSYSTGKLKFYSRDVREPLIDIFAQNKVDTALHLAFIIPPKTHIDAYGVNIGGSRRFLEACEATSVEALFYLSSHTVYGAHPDNPAWITEDQPLRPVRKFPYAAHKAEVDLMFQEYMKSHAKQNVTIVRVCPVTGPEGGGAGLTVLLMPVMIYVTGYDPQWQFIHEEDVARLIVTMLKERHAGIFNAGAEGSISYGGMRKATGRPCVGLPVSLMLPLIDITWRLHIQRKSPVGGIEFLRYPILVSTGKLTKTTGFKFRYSSREALMSLLASKKRSP